MTRVGIVAMSCKPYHVGHKMLIDIASRECDAVRVFISTADRENVTGERMKRVWELIEPTLPENVEIELMNPSSVSPVRRVYELLGDIDKGVSSLETYVLYGDPQDLEGAFSERSLRRYLPRLFESSLLTRRAVARDQTRVISGTMMREWLRRGDHDSFINGLPDNIDREITWSLLSE